MPLSAKQAASRPVATAVFNVPNQLTALRLALAVVLFVLVELESYLAGTVVFVIAASTDWLDGYWARKYGQVTTIGRVFDPFVDKIIICGTFVFLAAAPGSGIVAWMAVVVVGREMLVTALRGFIEQHGGDFSARTSGKLKMLLQCLAAGLSLYGLTLPLPDPLPAYGPLFSLTPPDAWGRPAWLAWSLPAAVWLALAATAYSGLEYLVAAARVLRR
jgi:CDP-diacylglycerol--glycerol-3-phosphate 3-phosphatidyltransferase